MIGQSLFIGGSQQTISSIKLVLLYIYIHIHTHTYICIILFSNFTIILISSNPLLQKGTEGFDEPQQKSGVSAVRGTPGEVHSGTVQDMAEEEGDEVGENADSAPGTPAKPGILTQLARLV